MKPRELTDDERTARTAIIDNFLAATGATRTGMTVKSLADALKWSESKVRRVLAGPAGQGGIDGITARREITSGRNYGWVYYATSWHLRELLIEARAATTPTLPAGAISVPMTRLDAWATVRALAVANDVPEHYDGHRDEKHVRTWTAQRIINLLDPATDAAATVDAHCTGGCADIRITRAAFETGACPFCGRDLDSVEGARGE